MRFDILTLFPEPVEAMMHSSILGRAQKKGLIEIHAHQIRDYTANRQNQVDDYPYGGGRGAILQCDPLYRCWCAICDDVGAPVHTIFLSACGSVFNQEKAKQMQRDYENVILVCGHYEGIDQRFIDECVDEEISLGDFVLTGGELPAMMIADAVCRLVPGVLGDEVCFTDESHWDGLLEYPQYSRPEIWHGLAVPEVLLSGNHQNIDRWRKKQSILRTMYRRPDMFGKLRFPYKTRAERKFVAELEAENEDFRNRDPKNLDYRK